MRPYERQYISPGQLRGRVEMVGRGEQDVLVECLRAGRVAVDPDRAAVDDVPDLLVARGLEHDRGATGVHELGAQRVPGDLVDVRDGGQVDHAVAALIALRNDDPSRMSPVMDSTATESCLRECTRS